jgi:hypothetical protein
MDPGQEVELNPQPIPPGRMAVYRALREAVFSSLLEGDEGPSGGVDPHGPGGPVMRDAVVAVAISQMASLLGDEGLRNEIKDLASRALGSR